MDLYLDSNSKEKKNKIVLILAIPRYLFSLVFLVILYCEEICLTIHCPVVGNNDIAVTPLTTTLTKTLTKTICEQTKILFRLDKFCYNRFIALTF